MDTDTLAPGLGASQRLLLGWLKRQGPSTIGDLEARSDLARESLRDQLGALAAAGLVERQGVRRAGRGRPGVVYRLSARGESLFPQREGELLGEMARFLIGAGRADLLERFFVARVEGKRARLEGRVAGLAGVERAREVARILDEEGFLAEIELPAGPGPAARSAAGQGPGRGRLKLCHCPLREMVQVSHLPCRAEMRLVEDLLGTRLERESFMPDGASSCTYSFPLTAKTSARRSRGRRRRAENPPSASAPRSRR